MFDIVSLRVLLYLWNSKLPLGKQWMSPNVLWFWAFLVPGAMFRICLNPLYIHHTPHWLDYWIDCVNNQQFRCCFLGIFAPLDFGYSPVFCSNGCLGKEWNRVFIIWKFHIWLDWALQLGSLKVNKVKVDLGGFIAI